MGIKKFFFEEDIREEGQDGDNTNSKEEGIREEDRDGDFLKRYKGRKT